MGLKDKLPPAEEHFTPEAVEQAARLAEGLAEGKAAFHEALDRAADDGPDEYELADDTPPEEAVTGPMGLKFRPTVVDALRRARADMPKVQKRDRFDGGGAGKFNFRGVDRIVNATRPVLNKHGIVIYPEVLDCQRRDVPRKEGGRSTETVLRVAWHVVGPSGDELHPCPIVMGEALDTSDKSMAKALSVSQREMLVKLLHIATGDPDPDSMMIERGDDIDRGQVVVYNPMDYREEAMTASPARLNQMINDLQRLGVGHEMVPNEHEEQERLGSMLVRLRRERQRG